MNKSMLILFLSLPVFAIANDREVSCEVRKVGSGEQRTFVSQENPNAELEYYRKCVNHSTGTEYYTGYRVLPNRVGKWYVIELHDVDPSTVRSKDEIVWAALWLATDLSEGVESFIAEGKGLLFTKVEATHLKMLPELPQVESISDCVQSRQCMKELVDDISLWKKLFSEYAKEFSNSCDDVCDFKLLSVESLGKLKYSLRISTSEKYWTLDVGVTPNGIIRFNDVLPFQL